MISVIIPTYKGRDLILATLDSVFAQTYTDYEVIVINDGSPDDTAEVLRPLVEAGRIVYIEQPNGGQGAARRRAIEQARGEYIALLDHDDLWPPDKLEWQAAILREWPEVVLVFGDYVRIDPDGSITDPIRTKCPPGPALQAFLLGCWILSPGQTLIRASALREAGGFDPSIAQSDDWDLYIRLAGIGEFHYEPRVALQYRVHAGNDSRRALSHARNHFKVVRKHLVFKPATLLAHLKAASPFFVPNLLRYGHESRSAGDYAEAARAHLYVLAFQPRLLVRRFFIAGLAGSLLHRPPRNPSTS